MLCYESPRREGVLLVGDSERLPMIPSGSIAVILTSPAYWVRGRGRDSASRYSLGLALRHGREWHRVLSREGDLWLVIGDRHDGREWIGMDGIVTESFRRTGWRLQTKAFWLEHPSRARWDSRINYLLRFRKKGKRRVPPRATLCWRLPMPRSPRGTLWDATAPRIVRALLELSRPGPVLDPFFGVGTVAVEARRAGRPWIGVERDRRQVRVAVRQLDLRRGSRDFGSTEIGALLSSGRVDRGLPAGR
ncbi:MAG: DNA methyltransferase [Candidatus Binatia bacterium]